MDSIDAGVSPANLEHILDSSKYFQKLDDLELETAQRCGIDQRLTFMTASSLEEYLMILDRCRDALCNLKAHGFCESTFNILVNDDSRPDIAKAVHISLDEIESLMSSLKSTTDGNILSTKDVQSSILPLMQSLLGDKELERRSSTPAGWQSNLQFLCATLQIGLVSFSGSHVCRFDQSICGFSTDEVPIGLGYSFRHRSLPSLANFIGDHVWILGQSKTQLEQEELRISLTCEDIQLLWGPLWLLKGILKTETGFIIPREQPSNAHGEYECYWKEDLEGLPMPENADLRGSSRILI